MNINGVEITVTVHGRPVKEYVHEGKSFIEARYGTAYNIHVKNNNIGRVLVIPSVDGLNVITGKPATPTDTGYIVDKYSFIDIKGFRVSSDTSAEFVFSKKHDSYAAEKQSTTTNCGVIGAMVFAEQIRLDDTYAVCYASTRSFPAKTQLPPLNMPSDILRKNACACAPEEFYSCALDAGTAWGRAQCDVVNEVEFIRGTKLGEFSIYYATKKALQKMGIQFSEALNIASLPKAFNAYCSPPKSWTGKQ